MKFALLILLLPFMSISTQSLDITNILKNINNIRNLHQAPPVTWDNGLATVALNWAVYLNNNNVFKHSNSNYGENLAYIMGERNNNTAITRSISLWYDENTEYNYDKPGFSMETGHFTQLVWVGTKQIGAGVLNGYVVMEYNPPGNVMGYKTFETNVLPPMIYYEQPLLYAPPSPPPPPLQKSSPPPPRKFPPPPPPRILPLPPSPRKSPPPPPRPVSSPPPLPSPPLLPLPPSPKIRKPPPSPKIRKPPPSPKIRKPPPQPPPSPPQPSPHRNSSNDSLDVFAGNIILFYIFAITLYWLI